MINKLVFQNMLTFGGNNTHEIDFSTPNVAEISGDNGTGKSNITRILKMATHFDYPFVQNKLVNDRCENGFIEIHTDQYVIRHEYTKKHGLKAIFVSDKDGVLKDTGGVSSTKKWISENVFDIPKDMFYNVFIPNIANFKSFIGMKPSDTKLIRDELFSLTSINKKLEKVKSNISSLDKDISLMNADVETKKNFIDHLDTQILEAEAELEEKTAEKTAEIEDEISLKKITKDTLTAKLDCLKNDLIVLNKNLSCLLYSSKMDEKKNLVVELKNLEAEAEAEAELKKSTTQLLEVIDTKELLEKKSKIETEINDLKKIIGSDTLILDAAVKEKNGLSFNIQCSDLTSLENSILVLDEEIKALDGKIKLLSNEREIITSSYSDLKAEYNDVVEKLKIIELGETCPTCSQPIPDSLLKMKEKLLLDKKTKHAALLLMVEESNSKKKDIEENTSLFNSKTSERLNTAKQQQNLKESLGDISEIVLLDVTETKTKIQNISDEIITLTDAIAKNNKKVSVNESLLEAIIIKDIDISLDTNGLDKTKVGEILDASNEKIGYLKSTTVDTNKKLSVLKEEISKFSEEEKNMVVEDDITINGLEESIEAKKGDISEAESGILVLETELKAKETELEQMLESKLDSTLERLKKIKDDKTTEIESTEKTLKMRLKKRDNYKALEFVYSDAGLKKWILSKIRKSFTKSVNDDLNKFGLVAKFDDDFAVTLSKNGFDMPNEAISTGQKKMFDTIVCMNFIILYSSKNNIKLPIILDECLANLRKANAEKLVKLVKEKLVSRGFSVKFVNHGKLNDNLCDLTYLLTDERQYTNITIK